MKKKIRHKKEGWTGTIEIVSEQEIYSASHRIGWRADYVIYQNSHKPNGKYVEDPSIDSLNELEFLEDKK